MRTAFTTAPCRIRVSSLGLTLALVAGSGCGESSRDFDNGEQDGGAPGRGGSAGAGGATPSDGSPDRSDGKADVTQEGLPPLDGALDQRDATIGVDAPEAEAESSAPTGCGVPGSACCDDGAACSGGSTCVQGSCNCDAAHAACSGACVDTKSDPHHCGACGHDCLGGVCDRGLCQPFQLTSGQNEANEITVDATSAYWTRSSNARHDGMVLRMKNDGTGSVETLYSVASQSARGPSVGGGSLYWIAAGSVWHCTLAACTSDRTPIATTPALLLSTLLDLGNNQLFFSQGSPYATKVGALWVMSLPGGTPASIGPVPSDPAYLDKDDRFIYWINGSTYTNDQQNPDALVMKAPLAGGTPVANLLSSFKGDPGRIAVGPDSVYLGGSYIFSGATNFSAGLFKIALPNGLGTATPPTFAAGSVAGLVVDDRYVYWTTGNTGTVVRCPHTGCNAGTPEVLASNQSYPYGMAQDDKAIYWVTSGDSVTPETGTVMKLAK